MTDSEGKIVARASLKVPQNLLDRLADEARRLKKERGLRTDPALWTVVEAALSIYLRKGPKETDAHWERYEKYRDEIEKLYKILTSSNAVLSTAIRANLEAFSLQRGRVTDSRMFYPATSQQELEIYAIVNRILHEVGLPQTIRQAFFKSVEEAKAYAAEHDKKLLEMPRKNAK